MTEHFLFSVHNYIMSSAFYPQGMNSWNNRTPQGGYKSWKGKGIFSNPVGVTATHIRPLTNNDPGNFFPTGFGLPRPIKHHRKGTVIPYLMSQMNQDVALERNLNRAVQSSKGASLGGGSGGSGMISQMMGTPGSFVVKDNNPESISNYIGIINDDSNLASDPNKMDKECKTCEGVGIVSNWYPINNLTDKPQLNVTNPLLCCNAQRKARQRVLPTSTLVKKNYFQTNYMYLYNRCQTFEQRQFNFVYGIADQAVLDILQRYPNISPKVLAYIKPGDPLSFVNTYVAQCNPNTVIDVAVLSQFLTAVGIALLENNIITKDEYDSIISLNFNNIQAFIAALQKLPPQQTALALSYLYRLASIPYNGQFIIGPSNPKGCSQVFYKPNNPQYAQQGGVSASTRTLKLDYDTIQTNAAFDRKFRGANSAAEMTLMNYPEVPFAFKYKVEPCSKATYSGNPFFFQGQKQKRQICVPRVADANTAYVSVNDRSAGNYIGSTMP